MTITPKIPLWEVPKEWPGATAFCIGGGPSLTPEQVEMVHDFSPNNYVIAVNDAYRIAPWADILYACDYQWWRWHEGVPEFEGVKVGLRGCKDGAGYEGDWNGTDYPDVMGLAYNGIEGLEVKDPRFVRSGKNSGYQAINLAVHLGAKRIILLGYDMQNITIPLPFEVRDKISKVIVDEPDPVKSAIMAALEAVSLDHWFGAHPNNITSHPFPQMLKAFESLRSAKSLYGVEIINCTPGSALEVFPKIDLEEALNDSC